MEKTITESKPDVSTDTNTKNKPNVSTKNKPDVSTDVNTENKPDDVNTKNTRLLDHEIQIQ